MSKDFIDAHCLSKIGATKEYSTEWAVDRYLVGGKYFGLRFNDDTGDEFITLKHDPHNGDFLREQYEDILPGYYSNKLHWSTVKLTGTVPTGVIKDMINESYELVFAKLTKKFQKEILETEK